MDRHDHHSSTLRLLAIGDCNTAGKRDAAAEESVPGRLRKLLADRGLCAELQNLGYTMSTSREGVARARLDAHPADLLMLNFGLVDAWVTSIPGVYVPYYPDSRAKKIGRKLLKSLKRRLRAGWLRQFVPVGEVVPLDEYRKNMAEIIAAARANNPHVSIILWGTPPTRTNTERNATLERYNRALAGLADDLDAAYVDTAPLLEPLSEDEIYLDEVHLAPPATLAIAVKIAAEYLKLAVRRAA